MSLGLDQIYNYVLEVGSNPRIGYRTQAPVASGDTVEYRNPTTGVITTHTVTEVAFEEPTESKVTGSYQRRILYPWPPLTTADHQNDTRAANYELVTREEGFGTSSKVTVIKAS